MVSSFSWKPFVVFINFSDTAIPGRRFLFENKLLHSTSVFPWHLQKRLRSWEAPTKGHFWFITSPNSTTLSSWCLELIFLKQSSDAEISFSWPHSNCSGICSGGQQYLFYQLFLSCGKLYKSWRLLFVQIFDQTRTDYLPVGQFSRLR